MTNRRDILKMLAIAPLAPILVRIATESEPLSRTQPLVHTNHRGFIGSTQKYPPHHINCRCFGGKLINSIIQDRKSRLTPRPNVIWSEII